MKKLLLIIFFIPLLFISLNAAGSDIEDNLNELERETFNQIYANDDLQTRLTRLEREFFGAKQSGNIEKRLDKLMSGKYYCDNGSFDEYSAITSTNSPNFKQNKGIKGVLTRILDDFSSQGITGYTPQIQSNYGGSYYDTSPYSIYTPFSSPFYRNKYYSPMNNFRLNDDYNTKRTTNPFYPKISEHRPHHNKHYRKYRPTNYNSANTIGTRVTILND